eukprot:638029-Rhodomonas_salina.2
MPVAPYARSVPHTRSLGTAARVALYLSSVPQTPYRVLPQYRIPRSTIPSLSTVHSAPDRLGEYGYTGYVNRGRRTEYLFEVTVAK